MTGTNTYRSRAARAPEVPAENPRLCKATGCGYLGSVDLGGGGFCCRYHAWAAPLAWPEITQNLKELEWLADLWKAVRDEKGWRELATQFFESEPESQPHAKETRETYMYRLHHMIAYRSGSSSAPPRVLVPASKATAVNAAAAVSL